jgi:hypothetical protein
MAAQDKEADHSGGWCCCFDVIKTLCPLIDLEALICSCRFLGLFTASGFYTAVDISIQFLSLV